VRFGVREGQADSVEPLPDGDRERTEVEYAAAQAERERVREYAKGLLGKQEAEHDLASTQHALRRLEPLRDALAAGAGQLRTDLERLRDHIDHGFEGEPSSPGQHAP